MRLQHDVGEVKSRGFGETSNFKIAMSAHAFKVLSSQVYGNPTLATIRELICNAVDAHRKAGKLHVPVQVQAPSRLDPRFIVKDFGTGLSPEAVVTLYTTYFASDKNDSDELIGGLGIGAKAPFSVTKSFIVESRWHGKLYTFAAVIGSDGVPAISMQNDPMPTVEPNGLTIYVPVPESKIESFRSQIKPICARFDPLPEVNGLTLEPVVYSFKGDGWALRKTKDANQSLPTTPMAVMGSVPYPISVSEISNLTEDMRRLFSLPIDFLCDIGNLEIQASREGLHYTDATQQKLRELAEKAVADLRNTLQAEVSKATTLVEAKFAYSSIMQSVRDAYTFKALVRGHIKWGDEEINDTYLEFEKLTAKKYDKADLEKKYPRATHEYGPKIDLCDAEFIIGDVKNYIPHRISAWLAQRYDEVDRHRKFWVFHENDIPVLEAMNLNYTRVSAMPEVQRPPRPKRPKNVKKILKFDFAEQRFIETTHDVSKGGLYVNLHTNLLLGPKGGRLYMGTLAQVKHLLNLPDIYAFPASYKDIPLKNKRWHLVWDIIEPHVKKVINSSECWRYVADNAEARARDTGQRLVGDVLADNIDKITSQRARRFVEAHLYYQRLKKNHKIETALELGRIFPKPLAPRTVKPTVNVTKTWDDLVKARPLVRPLGALSYRLGSHADDIISYIN